MTWTVVWAPEAGEELQRVLRASRFKQQLATEVVQIDARLPATRQALASRVKENVAFSFNVPSSSTLKSSPKPERSM